MLRRLLIVSLLVIILIGALVPVVAQSGITATALRDVNVRPEPNIDNQPVGVIRAGTTVVVEGRNPGSLWLFVRTEDSSVRGWVDISFLALSEDARVNTLPVVSPAEADAGSADTPEVSDDPEATPGVEATEFVIPEENLDLPTLVLTEPVLANVRAIYARGQQSGKSPASFMKIGESNTAGTVFLCPFEWGTYELGDYGELQGIIDLFNQTKSFCRYNQTAQNGFATSNVLDSTWADPNDCEPNETPLACEVRRNVPAYAIIYMGIGDMGRLSPERYQENLTTMIRFLSDNGVVPIITTFPMADSFNRDGNPQMFNQISRDVAAATRVPLIDLRVATYEYSNHGTGPDGYHLSVRDTAETTFTGDELMYGRTLRELLTLQVLNQLNAMLNP
jgi:hypothetical protein